MHSVTWWLEPYLYIRFSFGRIPVKNILSGNINTKLSCRQSKNSKEDSKFPGFFSHPLQKKHYLGGIITHVTRLSSFKSKQSEIQCWQEQDQLEVLHKLTLQYVSGKWVTCIKKKENDKEMVEEESKNRKIRKMVARKKTVMTLPDDQKWDMDQLECLHSIVTINSTTNKK